MEISRREAAAGLLQLSGEMELPIFPCEPFTIVHEPAESNKRGRKPKPKIITPQRMKTTQKVFLNYKRCYTDKLASPVCKEMQIKEGHSLEQNILQGKRFYSHGEAGCSLPMTSMDKKINKIRIVKDLVDGEKWVSSRIPRGRKGPVSAEPKRSPFKSSFETMPPSWLPFKKRKLDLSFQNMEMGAVALSEPLTVADDLPEKRGLVSTDNKPKTAEDSWLPLSPESLAESIDSPLLELSQDKETLEEEIGVWNPAFAPEATVKYIKSDHALTVPGYTTESAASSTNIVNVVKVILPGQAVQPKTEKAVNPKAVVVGMSNMKPLPTVKFSTSALMAGALGPPFISSRLPGLCCLKTSRTCPLKVSTTQPEQQSSSKPQGCSSAASYPLLSSQVCFRIMCDSWPMQPKCSVYEVQPINYRGHTPRSLVSTFVLFHWQRSETKSLQFLNKFPTLCDVKFEYLPKLALHSNSLVSYESHLLPDHVIFQQATEDQFFGNDNLNLLKSQFPNCSFFQVQEEQKLVVNKVAVVNTNEATGYVHIKVFAFSSELTKSSSQTKSMIKDSWFSYVVGTLEVFRLTIPAWMFFSREVIRLHKA